MDHIKSSALLAGRILLSGIFLMSGAMKIVNWSGTAAAMQGEGMPAVPVFLALAIAAEMIGGLAVLLGCYARPAALMLALYLVPVTLTFHHFWTYEGSARENQMQHFAKNVTIIGGLVTLAGAGAGRFSLDARRPGRVFTSQPSRTEEVPTRRKKEESMPRI